MFDFVEQFFHGRPDQKQAAYRFQRASLQLKPTESVTSETSRSAKKPGIAYDQSLIKDLEKGHEILIENFGRTLNDGFERRDFTLLSKQLGEFKVLFQSHLLKENVKLFCYLEQSMKSDPTSLLAMRGFRKDINYWSSAVISFCKKHEQPIEVFFEQDSFKSEYQAVGRALIHRVQLVESEMYPLYAPN